MPALSEIRAKNVCTTCINEPVLKSTLRTTGTKSVCSYCKRTRNCLTLEAFADIINFAFEEHFIRVDDDDNGFGYLSHYGMPEDDGIPIIDAISDAAGISVKIAGDVQLLLVNRYSSRSAYEMGERIPYEQSALYQLMRPSDAGMREDWDAFEDELKHRARFFNKRGASLLATVFDNIGRLAVKEGRKLMVTGGPGSGTERLYRARVFQSETTLLEALKDPEKNLGAPPAKLAATGRMNAKGISVFYGSDTLNGAVAEVRPPVGSNVAVAGFDIVGQVTLLDLTALPLVQHANDSIFDPLTKKRMERIVFLQSLGERMTKPVMPDDQDIEYLVTQAIADFLSTECDPRFDGIIFNSVQTDNSRNVVLFNHASTAEKHVLPEGTELNSFRFHHHGGDEDTSILVFEKVPKTISEPLDGWGNWAGAVQNEPTLRLDRSNITVHNITGVTFLSESTPVKIQRIIKDDDEF